MLAVLKEMSINCVVISAATFRTFDDKSIVTLKEEEKNLICAEQFLAQKNSHFKRRLIAYNGPDCDQCTHEN